MADTGRRARGAGLRVEDNGTKTLIDAILGLEPYALGLAPLFNNLRDHKIPFFFLRRIGQSLVPLQMLFLLVFAKRIG